MLNTVLYIQTKTNNCAYTIKTPLLILYLYISAYTKFILCFKYLMNRDINFSHCIKLNFDEFVNL